VLTQKYGSQYLHKYFGFHLKDFAKKMGIANNSFTQILKGKRRMQEKYSQAFLNAFDEFRVREKSENFQETPAQLQIKELRKKLKKT